MPSYRSRDRYDNAYQYMNLTDLVTYVSGLFARHYKKWDRATYRVEWCCKSRRGHKRRCAGRRRRCRRRQRRGSDVPSRSAARRGEGLRKVRDGGLAEGPALLCGVVVEARRVGARRVAQARRRLRERPEGRLEGGGFERDGSGRREGKVLDHARRAAIAPVQRGRHGLASAEVRVWRFAGHGVRSEVYGFVCRDCGEGEAVRSAEGRLGLWQSAEEDGPE